MLRLPAPARPVRFSGAGAPLPGRRPRAARRIRGLALCLLLAAGCDLFVPRAPEQPESGGGTWLQPDTPERVVENLQAAVAEMNSQNYLRSLAAGFTFEPTTAARTRAPLVWSGWGRTEEEAYFRRLQAAAAPFSGHSLQLLDINRSVIGTDRYLFDATYLLTIRHSRVDEGVAAEVQGHLVWEITLGENGLWQLSRWTDQELGSKPSWSDLKEAFAR